LCGATAQPILSNIEVFLNVFQIATEISGDHDLRELNQEFYKLKTGPS